MHSNIAWRARLEYVRDCASADHKVSMSRIEEQSILKSETFYIYL